ncbi:MAG TPA: hypothetical protein ENH28_05865 [Euryarchaeota archaeon]|nr:hypothetical protein [Euryarchaeota archaeon]
MDITLTKSSTLTFLLSSTEITTGIDLQTFASNREKLYSTIIATDEFSDITENVEILDDRLKIYFRGGWVVEVRYLVEDKYSFLVDMLTPHEYYNLS